MASWYERRILPHIIRFGCGCQAFSEYRQEVVSQAAGRVLELGFGAGANLNFYDPASVGELVGIEPSAELRAVASTAPRANGLDVRFQQGLAENLPFEDASFDTVVCTFTLCTVAEPHKVLQEARRMLRPGGLFLFCEHGASPDAGVAAWQRRLDPAWQRVFGGCHLTRPVGASIERHFAIDELKSRYQPKMPRLAGWIEWGRAIAA